MKRIALFTHTQITPNNHSCAGKLRGRPNMARITSIQMNDNNVLVIVIIVYFTLLKNNTNIKNISRNPIMKALHNCAELCC